MQEKLMEISNYLYRKKTRTFFNQFRNHIVNNSEQEHNDNARINFKIINRSFVLLAKVNKV